MKLLSLFLVLLFSFSIFGQTKRPLPRKESPILQVKPFNTSVESLPPHFEGHNARLILPSLFSFALEVINGCGKFETTKVCQTRLNGIYERRILGSLTASDLLAFSIPVECDYNADVVKITCSNSDNSYTWAHRKVESRTYMGQNAFGVKKSINYSKFENIFIETDKSHSGFTLFDMKPDKAKTIVPNLRFLIVGELITPFVKTNPVSYKPTIDNPEHIDGNNYSVTIEMKEIWLYDFETGRVLRKEKIEKANETEEKL